MKNTYKIKKQKTKQSNAFRGKKLDILFLELKKTRFDLRLSIL